MWFFSVVNLIIYLSKGVFRPFTFNTIVDTFAIKTILSFVFSLLLGAHESSCDITIKIFVTGILFNNQLE